MKKRSYLSDDTNDLPRIYNGTNWYVANTPSEMLYTASQVQSALPAAVTANAVNTSTGYLVGCYYYGEWKTPGNSWNTAPWSRINNGYVERSPLLGQFSDDAQYVIDSEIKAAYEFGIDFFAFDFYYQNNGTRFNEQTILNFKSSPNKSLMKFCLNVCNHSDWPNTFAVWQGMIDYWITTYFSDPQYLKINGKPVVFIFDPDNLARKGQAMVPAKSSLSLLNEAKNRWIAAGGTGIHFVGCQQPHAYWIGNGKYLEANGYEAVSGYNYHYKYDGSIGYNWNGTFYTKAKSYNDKMIGYKNAWEWVCRDSGTSIPYYLPMTAGWDDRPWWPSADTDTLNIKNSVYWDCAPTKEEFKQHVQEVKTTMDAYPTQTSKICMIYAWNEYGEGGYIAPTAKYDQSFLESIKEVFGK